MALAGTHLAVELALENSRGREGSLGIILKIVGGWGGGMGSRLEGWRSSVHWDGEVNFYLRGYSDKVLCSAFGQRRMSGARCLRRSCVTNLCRLSEE